jgi:hypothetical protein
MRVEPSQPARSRSLTKIAPQWSINVTASTHGTLCIAL